MRSVESRPGSLRGTRGHPQWTVRVARFGVAIHPSEIEIRGKATGTILISGSSRAGNIGAIVTWRIYARGGTTAGQEKRVEGRNAGGD
jgi:hypothetical protein